MTRNGKEENVTTPRDDEMIEVPVYEEKRRKCLNCVQGFQVIRSYEQDLPNMQGLYEIPRSGCKCR